MIMMVMVHMVMTMVIAYIQYSYGVDGHDLFEDGHGVDGMAVMG
jgi:hypothetical protein